MNKPVIGFIGLGLMGANMVENLQKKGFELVVLDRNKEADAAVIARGNARLADSPKALAEASDIIMLCLTTSDVVEAVVYGDDGILAGIKAGAHHLAEKRRLIHGVADAGIGAGELGAVVVDQALSGLNAL